MAKYRKRPVIVEAEEYEPGMEDGIDYYCTWWALYKSDVGCDYCTKLLRCKKGYLQVKPYISTLENQKHYISPGDYIVVGVKGERYAIKPDILELTYELVGEEK